MTSNSRFPIPSSNPLVPENLTTASTATANARCTKCGKSMRHMPVFLQNITCRDCYDPDRYRPSGVKMSPAHYPEATASVEKAVNVPIASDSSAI